MRLLAIETSEMHGSVALLEDDRLQQELPLTREYRSAQALAPAISELLRSSGLAAKQLDAIAVGIGPGSFTGLRVGISTAKALAWALQIPSIGVGTLRSLAAQAATQLAAQSVAGPWPIVAASNAYRKQVFSATYEFATVDQCEEIAAPTTIDLKQWHAQWPDNGWVTGPGLSLLGPNLLDDKRVTNPQCWAPTAATIGRLGYRDLSEGKGGELTVEYGRVSAAEEG